MGDQSYNITIYAERTQPSNHHACYWSSIYTLTIKENEMNFSGYTPLCIHISENASLTLDTILLLSSVILPCSHGFKDVPIHMLIQIMYNFLERLNIGPKSYPSFDEKEICLERR